MEEFFDIFTFNFFLFFMCGALLFYMIFWMPVTRTMMREPLVYGNHSMEGLLDGTYEVKNDEFYYIL